MSGEKIWHSSNEEPQGVCIGECVVVIINTPAFYFKTLQMTKNGWVSSDGVNVIIEECLRWAYMRDVIKQAIGGVK